MFNRTERTQILSLSTRGIGFGTMYVATMARQYQQDITVPSIYSMYRAFLALLEAKLQICPILSRYPNFTLQYNLDAHMLHLARTTSFVPHPISRIINAVGILKYKERSYAPAVASSPISRAGYMTPIPNNLLLSNLRQNVVALSNPATPEPIRIRFEQNNPIPGAIWVDHLLMNPDEIMPENYNYNALCQDVFGFEPFLVSLQRHAPILVGEKLDFNSKGSRSLFVSNDMSNMHIQPRLEGETMDDYLSRHPYVGNITSYTTMYKLSPRDQLLGQINLLGERPPLENYVYPMKLRQHAILYRLIIHQY